MLLFRAVGYVHECLCVSMFGIKDVFVCMNGCCYVFGGQDYASGCLLADMQVLDLSNTNPAWSVVTPAAGSSPPCARSSHCCAAINEKIYIFGGSNSEGGLMNDMHCFNTETRVWHTIDNASEKLTPQPREMSSAVAVGDLIYIIGGRGEGGPLGSLGVLDANLNQWIEHKVPSIQGRMAQGAAAIDSSIFVFGGELLIDCCGWDDSTEEDEDETMLLLVVAQVDNDRAASRDAPLDLRSSSFSPSSKFILGNNNTVGDPKLPLEEGVRLTLLGLADRKLLFIGFDAFGERGGAGGIEDGALRGLGPW